MNRRLLAITLAGALILGTAAALISNHMDAGRETSRPVPLFVLSAQEADPRPSWPQSGGTVAFNDEMIALLTMGAAASHSARQAAARQVIEVVDEEPPRRMSRRERRRAEQEERARLRAERIEAHDLRAYARDPSRETVEVQVRDRHGNIIGGVRRVEREPNPRAPAPRHRIFAPYGRW